MADLTPFERMELACRRLGLSRGELAARLAVSTETVRQWGMNGIPTTQFERSAPKGSSTDAAAAPPLIWEQAVHAPIAWIEHGADPPVWWITELVACRRWSEVEEVRGQHARASARRAARTSASRMVAKQPPLPRSAWPELPVDQLDAQIFSAWRELVDGRLTAHLLSATHPYLLPGPAVPRWKFLLGSYRWYWGNQEPAQIEEFARSLGCWPISETNPAMWQSESLPVLLRRCLAHKDHRSATELADLPSSANPTTWTKWERALQAAVNRCRLAKRDPERRYAAQERVRVLLMDRLPDEPLVAGATRATVLAASLRAAWLADLRGPSSERIRSALEAALWCELANRRFTMAEVSRSLELRAGISVERNVRKPKKSHKSKVASSWERLAVVSDRTVCGVLRAIEDAGRESHLSDRRSPRVRCTGKIWSTLAEDLDDVSPSAPRVSPPDQ
jgi:hypothetical protein